MKNINPPVIDTHCDVIIPFQELKGRFSTAKKNTQTSLPLLKTAQVKIIFAGFSYDDVDNNTHQQLNDLKSMIQNYSDDFELVTNFKQIRKIIAGNKIGVILHIEGAGILDGSIKLLNRFYKEGVRSIGFTHNNKNSLGTGALINNQEGLTAFGKQVIEFCNDKKIILDLAHLNKKGFYDAIRLSARTPFVSHGNCYKLTKNPRNFDDQQLKKLSKLKSFIGVFFSGKYLKLDSNPKQATINDAVAHIKHMVSIMGIDCVGLGCDYGGITTSIPVGLENHASLIELFQRLRAEGFSSEDIEKIALKNALNFIEREYL